MILDFDHTLLLSNSTEEYLESLRPRWLAALLLTALDFVQPWRVLGGVNTAFVYADHVRVVLATLLFPWAALAWRARALHTARRLMNHDLFAAIEERPFVVASYGYGFLLRPLLDLFPRARAG